VHVTVRQALVLCSESEMVRAGIEALNVFGGTAVLDVNALAEHRRLDRTRFANLLMKEKAVALPYEDAISFGVNAAKPLIDALTPSEKNTIEMVIACSESGIDFGKSMSTYLHHYLGLSRNCRLFELKQACYSGTAGLQMAVSFVLSQAAPGARVLVVATDVSRFGVAEGGSSLTSDWSFAEPSSGAGAVALLVSENPRVMQLDVGASGYYGYEVMDTCRPYPDGDAGDADLSLMSYLDCCKQTFAEYRKRVPDADYQTTFDYLAFHTPFGGMVKGAHRVMMRETAKAAAAAIEEDFRRRVMPGLIYCQRVGNAMGATLLMALASTIDHAELDVAKRIGCFSYGSGCCSEFYSGVVLPSSQRVVRDMNIKAHLDSRYRLGMEEYEMLIRHSEAVKFGTRNVTLNHELLPKMWAGVHGTGRLYLSGIKEFHRVYEWA
jgi:polyketide biosynthesis 3-hydroxy-3-methylglutaryl-CoA synthase-like enzyme PksG